MRFIDAFPRAQAALLGLLTSLAALVGDDPPALAAPPDELAIESIEAHGSGCPTADTIHHLIAADRRSFLLIYDEMALERPGGGLVKNRSCSARIRLHVPSGWQAALLTVTTRGYVYLDAGIRARHTTRVRVAGDPIKLRPYTDFVGPHEELYDLSDEAPIETRVWSPCGKSTPVTISSILRLDARGNPDGAAIVSDDTADGHFQQRYGWALRPC